MSDSGKPRFARREMIGMIAAAAASPALLAACAPQPVEAVPPGPAPRRGGPAGTLTDPDLVNPVVPWELTLTADERATLAALCAVIIPADERSPSAADLGAHEFIDEWVSAPYEAMRQDRELVRDGIAWLDEESHRRFGARFRALDDSQKGAVCDDICWLAEAAPEHEEAAHFFNKTRDLAAMAFYTTREGMADVGYVGNVPLDTWGPPPEAVLRKAGLK